MKNKISVVIPIYNAAKYLSSTLQCILNQTYKNLEIICVLDAPTDNSEEIVRGFKDSRIKIIKNKQNMDLPTARNIGAAKAKGDWIHFMDSDDLLSPDFYEELIAVNSDCAQNNQQSIDVLACSVFYEKKPKSSIWFKDEIITGKAKIKKSQVLIHGWAWRWIIRRDFWDAHKFSFPNLRPMEDTPVTLQMVYYADAIALCSHAIYFYKNRPGSILNARNPQREKKNHENRHKARKIIHDFIRVHHIKKPSRLWHLITRK